MFGFDERYIGAFGPDFELLDGGGAEGVGCAEKDGFARRIFGCRAAEHGGELAAGGGLAGAVDSDEEDDFGRSGGMSDRLVDGRENVEELGLEEMLEFVAGRDAFAEGAFAKRCHDGGSGVGSDVGSEERELKVVEGRVVDLTGEGDDRGERAGKRFAGAGDRLLHAVEERKSHRD